jgi:hypothetical protein
VKGVEVWREVFGLEKTFFNGNASVEVRMPFNMLRTNGQLNELPAPPPGAFPPFDIVTSTGPAVGGTWTDLGDLTAVFKGVLRQNRQTGSLVSAGLAVTFPTGPDAFAGVSDVTNSFHDTMLQPFFGYIWRSGNFWLQGFTAVDIPTDSQDFLLLYNDLAAGYFVINNRTGGYLTGLSPTVEVHVNTPLNHRHDADCSIPDWIDITGGMNFVFSRRTTLALGVCTPVTGPKPWDIEAIAQLDFRY